MPAVDDDHRGAAAEIRVSVIIPVFNGAETIGRTLDSALAQDFTGAEIVVVDDGSTDQTQLILDRYGSRIRRLRQDNRGAAAARNTAAAVARGEYLAFLDADDTWSPDKLTRTYDALESNGKAVLVFSPYRRVLSTGHEIDPYVFSGAPSMRDMLTRRSEILPSAVVMRRDVFERCHGFSEQFPGNCFEDPYMWIRAREHGEFVYVPEFLMIYRLRESYVDERYLRNGRMFLSLVRKRYGSDAKGLIHDTHDHLAKCALQLALKHIDHGDHARALRWLSETMRLRPSLIFEPPFALRLVARRNVRRLLKMLRSPVALSKGL